MHVRVAWEIYHHQQKSGEAKGSIATAKSATDLLRTPHLFSPSVNSQRPHHELTFPPSLSSHHRPAGFDQPHPGSLFAPPTGHLGIYNFVIVFCVPCISLSFGASASLDEKYKVLIICSGHILMKMCYPI